ncbi:transmembrane protein 254-like [Gouania willdenowi]|uniref:Transmembrane protein 254 n=1 Tax=Gouania willdenowi TaxID=441366 RepID=A0A8C5E123_GOUWI|nr:transmembrane protein 254-like [Gouania willdenowi]XP_028324945.1 transmembrane protein 254-like [Gouania willdenowi]
MAKSDGCDYFKRTSVFWMLTIPMAITFFGCIVYVPEKLPLSYLGLFGSFCSYLVDNYSHVLYKMWMWTWVVHLAEALISLVVCSVKGITSVSSRCLWFFQTFLFGVASLGLLLKFNPERPKHQ